MVGVNSIVQPLAIRPVYPSMGAVTLALRSSVDREAWSIMADQADSNRAALDSFAAGAEALTNAVEPLTSEQLDLSAAPGAWSIRQIVHHLADDCDVWSMCIKKAIATPGVMVRFEGFPDNEAWADGLDFSRRGIDRSLALIRAHREYVVDLLTHFGNVWDRSFKLADSEGQVRQEFSVGRIVAMIGDHMHQHIRTIEAIKAQHGIGE
jgi:hypothetical protein